MTTMKDPSVLKVVICLILAINFSDSNAYQSDLNTAYTAPPNQFQNIPELRIKQVQTDAIMLKDSIKNTGKYFWLLLRHTFFCFI